MSLGRQIDQDHREPEAVGCPRCGALAGQDCTFSSPVPAHAVHPARYVALTGQPVPMPDGAVR